MVGSVTPTPQAPDRNLAMELVRVTEAAAMAAGRWMGRGDKNGADGAAVNAMRVVLDSISMDGVVVIGEGEKDHAPMLFNGEKIGDGSPPRTDIAVDPIDGTTLTALGRGGALAVIAVSQRGTMFDPGPCVYMGKIAVGPRGRGAVDIHRSPVENLHSLAEAVGQPVRDLTAVILDRPRPAGLIAEVRSPGARLRLITDGDVAGAIARGAVGDRLTAVLIDHGLLREGEGEEVQAAFSDIDLRVMDARTEFLGALKGVVDPEEKRKIIGREFIRAFERVQDQVGKRDVLIQGTVYPDVIESGGQGARTIKSHHNVGGLPDDVAFQVVEPLRWLFKDEVRRVGTALGLPESLVWRQPFPGPGLAVRIIGEVTEDKIKVLRLADAVVREEIRRAGLERSIWQAFAVLLDLRSVGVMGDARTYGYPIVVRAVESQDGMTADWVKLPYEVLEAIASRIVGEVDDVNRVVYDVTSKPPATIEWE